MEINRETVQRLVIEIVTSHIPDANYEKREFVYFQHDGYGNEKNRSGLFCLNGSPNRCHGHIYRRFTKIWVLTIDYGFEPEMYVADPETLEWGLEKTQRAKAIYTRHRIVNW